MTRFRKVQEPRGWAIMTAIVLLKPPLQTLTKREWVDAEKIPAKGGCVIVFNHVSHLDPITAAHVIVDAGRSPRYLAKSGLFKNKYLGAFLTSAGQIPVARMSADAVGAFDAAVQAIQDGKCVIVYPEGTITRDPGGWPMRGKSGAARIALETGCPVIPVGQWGAQEILPAYTKRFHFFPRKTIQVKVGDPVDLSDLADQPVTPELVQQTTDRIMAAVTHLVEDIRGGTAPEKRFDPRTAGVQEIGNPNKNKKKRKPA